MPGYDLHLHSSISDGVHNPTEVVHKAAEAGLSFISLTDHDSVGGIAEALEAASAFPALTVIPGVEISTESPGGEVHVLGYFIDYTHTGLLEALGRMRCSRESRARRMTEKLARLGYPVDWNRVQELAGEGSIGRPHIAQALLEKGYIETIKEAFTRFLTWGGPAYVERDKMTPEEAIALILEAGGLPVLAHPLISGDPESMIAELKQAGLVGIEAYYKDYNQTEVRTLVGLARRYGLLTTGGTDYHGLDANSEVPMGSSDVPPEAIEQLLDYAASRGLKRN